VKRLLAVPVLAVALAVPAAIAVAAPDDVKGPACADITDTSFFYSGDGTSATVDLTLGSARCRWVTYTLVVQDSASDTTFVADSSDALDVAPGVVSITASIPAADRDGEVCVYATTSVGPHVFDRGPDADLTPNCIELVPGGSGGGTGAN
jgi:hypothetical protein